jgi:hypothetical protein
VALLSLVVVLNLPSMRHMSQPNGVQNEHCLLALLVDESHTQGNHHTDSYNPQQFITCNVSYQRCIGLRVLGKRCHCILIRIQVNQSHMVFPNTEWATFVVIGY